MLNARTRIFYGVGGGMFSIKEAAYAYDNADFFPLKRGNVPGGARVGGTRSGRVGSSCSFWRR